MAMFPNATHGYMPFVSESNNHRSSSSRRSNHTPKYTKENRKLGNPKAYKVTLKDRHGYTYTYIVQADGSKSLPSLCGAKFDFLVKDKQSHSLPNIQKSILVNTNHINTVHLDKDEKDSVPKTEKKQGGLLASLLKFLSTKTKSKSKRKPRPAALRKRQRTVSNMSNLEPIQESPDEDEDYTDDDDDESYSHSDENDSIPESAAS